MSSTDPASIVIIQWPNKPNEVDIFKILFLVYSQCLWQHPLGIMKKLIKFCYDSCGFATFPHLRNGMHNAIK